jgi:3-hydroxymyristoyl/3-hydroxydecanoyl-(acyl carrier protein) dehydratase
VLLNELHMAHFAQGDQALALGPEYAIYRGRRTARLPNRELQLVDRLVAVQGRRGDLDAGGSCLTEYDAPADAWYYAGTGHTAMPTCVLLEIALQSSSLLGYYLGATLERPQLEYSVRNLDGEVTLLRDIDLRDVTIRQRSELESTTRIGDSVLQRFRFELAVGGVAFSRGAALFGFFTAEALANPTGVDAGRRVPPWLHAQQPPPPTKTVDVATRRASGAPPRAANGLLALVDEVRVVPDGGPRRLGSVSAELPVTRDAWWFSRHFHRDPVMPGSLAIEAIIQTLQEWLVATGHLDSLRDARFVPPVGAPLRWRYRGQVLPSDPTVSVEAHVTAVERRRGRVRVGATASLWNDGLRIYHVEDLAVEACAAGASPW